jgi:hypothetical protein
MSLYKEVDATDVPSFSPCAFSGYLCYDLTSDRVIQCGEIVSKKSLMGMFRKMPLIWKDGTLRIV